MNRFLAKFIQCTPEEWRDRFWDGQVFSWGRHAYESETEDEDSRLFRQNAPGGTWFSLRPCEIEETLACEWVKIGAPMGWSLPADSDVISAKIRTKTKLWLKERAMFECAIPHGFVAGLQMADALKEASSLGLLMVEYIPGDRVQRIEAEPWGQNFALLWEQSGAQVPAFYTVQHGGPRMSCLPSEFSDKIREHGRLPDSLVQNQKLWLPEPMHGRRIAAKGTLIPR